MNQQQYHQVIVFFTAISSNQKYKYNTCWPERLQQWRLWWIRCTLRATQISGADITVTQITSMSQKRYVYLPNPYMHAIYLSFTLRTG